MAARLIIDGNTVYEIDEECLECQKKRSSFQAWSKQKGCAENQRERHPGEKDRS